MSATRTQVILSVVLSLGSSVALAGTVRFDPATTQIDASNASTTATLSVYIESSDTLASFNSVDLLIGSNDLAVIKFQFDPTFETATALRAISPQSSASPYASGQTVGGFALTPLTAPLLVGTLTIDTAGLPIGSYAVTVDGIADGGRSTLLSSDTPSELIDLFGNATISVVGSTVPPPTLVGCNVNADCTGAGVCTNAACVAGVCVSVPIQDCKACTVDGDCNDGNPCNTGTCVASLCRHTASTGPCDDGDPCTQNDVCSAFACAGTALAGCNGSAPNTPTTTGMCGAIGVVMLLGMFVSLGIARRANLMRRAP